MDEGLKSLIAKAEQGDVKSMVMVGDCYNRGLYTNKDDSKAQVYYKMAADNGHPGAMFMVGLGYLNGIGVEQNMVTAVKYIQDAANKGVANAQYIAGSLYHAGKAGTFFKNRKAIKYYKMAAKQGHADAQYKLGKIYLLKWSHGSNRHFDKGLFWILCASLHTSKKSAEVSTKAKDYINRIISELGFPKEAVKWKIEQIKREHPGYIIDPTY
ncbi:sel1 repeat family protein [Ruminococcaceae bacterium AM07-15]|nr:sel1 repeat family protein [Ruminococcaceae bacterium AM07-15]